VAFLKTEAPVGGRQLSGALVQLELSGALVQLELSGAQVISGAAGVFWLSDDSGAGAKRKLLVKSSEQYFLQRLHQLQLKWVEDCA